MGRIKKKRGTKGVVDLMINTGKIKKCYYVQIDQRITQRRNLIKKDRSDNR